MKNIMGFRALTWGCTALFIAGCASQPRGSIEKAVEPAVDIAAVLESPDQYSGQKVRWGGTISNIENRAETTRVEIVSRRLEAKGRPKSDDDTSGRFIAIIDKFLDPGVYTKDRQITVHGTLAGTESGKIGGYDYSYPLVIADTHRLWKPLPQSTRYYDPYRDYDPWFYRPYFYRPYFYRPYYDPFNPYSFYY